MSDLRARDEQSQQDGVAAQQQARNDLRAERKAEFNLQKSRLDDLTPRAESGTKERRLEKKREKADAHSSFAASKDVSGDIDVKDSDMMGDEDSLGELKRMKLESERRKNEREIRKEEIFRARKAEREARLAVHREKEENTMKLFKEIARQRFGADLPPDDT
jgi:hypothetical protein